MGDSSSGGGSSQRRLTVTLAEAAAGSANNSSSGLGRQLILPKAKPIVLIDYQGEMSGPCGSLARQARLGSNNLDFGVSCV